VSPGIATGFNPGVLKVYDLRGGFGGCIQQGGQPVYRPDKLYGQAAPAHSDRQMQGGEQRAGQQFLQNNFGIPAFFLLYSVKIFRAAEIFFLNVFSGQIIFFQKSRAGRCQLTVVRIGGFDRRAFEFQNAVGLFCGQTVDEDGQPPVSAVHGEFLVGQGVILQGFDKSLVQSVLHRPHKAGRYFLSAYL